MEQEINDEEFERLGKESQAITLEEIRIGSQEKIREAYLNILDLYNKYGDLDEIYPPILACWVIGTYNHNSFPSYPFLFFNAMKGSGKSRILRLTMDLAKEGQVNNSMTEAVLFRTNGALGIDEFEGVSRKGIENLRELLNSAYKKGTKVRRMKKKKTLEGEELVVEEFETYRPLALANIYGMEDVLGDRTIPIILEKSNKISVVNLIEVWQDEKIFIETKKILNEISKGKKDLVSFSVCRYTQENVYLVWNNFIINNITAGTNNDTKQHTYIKNTPIIEFFEKIRETRFNGRELEITFPILLIADLIGKDVLEIVIKSLTGIIKGKRDEQLIESRDVSFIDFISQFVEDNAYVSIGRLSNEFKGFLQEDESEEKWINPKWIGRALKRLKLAKSSRRLTRGREVILDVEKAQEKIKMFK